MKFEVLICREAVRQKSFHLPYIRAEPIDNFVHVDEDAVRAGSGVGIDERRVTRQQRTTCVGDRMVKSPKMKEMTKKLKAIEFETTYERDKERF